MPDDYGKRDLDINPAARGSSDSYVPTPVMRAEHAEGTFTRLIEHQVAKVPSDVFLFASLGCVTASVAFELKGKHRLGRFFQMWVPSLLVLGLYNKLVKIAGTR